ncbi:hypothetical protein V1291_003631 [Nitrobacteraceae bacterium AZCC 1564]
MAKLENTNNARSSSQNQTGKIFDLDTGLIAEMPASAEFSTDIDAALTEALKESFPASDPISSLRAA